jgi:molybdenum cofactor cytidylyltransferase
MRQPKALLAHRDGRSFLRAACESLEAARLAPLVVVLGHHRALLEAELQSLARPPRIAVNPAPDRGQLSSICTGFAALADEVPCALVALVDQPTLNPRVISQLIEGAADAPDAVHLPVYNGLRGHPAIFPTALGAEFRRAKPEWSARDLIAFLNIRVCEYRVDVPDVLIDLDTPEELAAWRAQHDSSRATQEER